MASKNYHITPDGPQRCKKSLRECPYASHFGSEELAFEAQQILEDDAKRLQRIKDQKEFLVTPDRRYVIDGAISFFTDSRNGSVRQYANVIERQFRETDCYPDILRAKVAFYTHNGSHKPVEVTVDRTIGVHQETGDFIGEWSVKTETTLSEYRLFEEIKEETTLDFSSESATALSMKKMREVFQKAVELGATYDIDKNKLDEEVDGLFAKFKTVFNALESESLGDYNMWDRGYGYFQGSDGQTIVANEDYETSAFRAENVRRFLKRNPYYASFVPQVEIRVSDRNERTGAGWAVYKSNKKWYVSETNADGSGLMYECSDHHQIYDVVNRVVFEKINPGQDAVAHEKAKYASTLMDDVEYYLDKHRTSVSQYWKEMTANSPANKRMKTNADLYGIPKKRWGRS